VTSPFPIRPISQDEFAAYYAVLEHAFNSTRPTEPEMRHDLAVFEFDRTLAAFDGKQIVGTAAAFTLQLSVPGGVAATAGIAAVSVLPTHRRRGILTSLMHRQLTDIHDRGEAVAALFASESAIYGRYGYGAAAIEAQFTIRRGEGSLRAPALTGAGTAQTEAGRASPRLRITEPRQAAAQLAEIYREVLRGRPGLPARDDRWWDFVLWDPEHRRSGSSPLRCVIAEDEAGARGYALYTTHHGHGHHWVSGDEIRVRELMASDPVAYAALWRDLLSRDLVDEVIAPMRPADDPLLHLLADSRRARPELSDAMWVRLVSVPRALAQRRYAGPVDLVLEVSDDVLSPNAGRWRLQAPGLEDSADSPAAVCERTTAPPDVALPVAALASAYLGGTRLGTLAGAGLVTELRPGSLARLSAALSWDPGPWSPAGF
jgi:predicted acetyltransferase